jgi:uncharacterized damage-inducible protein DinB
MPTEVEDLQEHFTRYRGVTLEHLVRLRDDQLAWRPRPDAFSCGQHFVHIVQSEQFYMPGLFDGEWEISRLRFPSVMPTKTNLLHQFEAVRRETMTRFRTLTAERLAAIIPPMFGATLEWSLRSWLWYVLEHEIHHKAQIAEYLRQLGIVPPFFAIVLPEGQRPDIKAREDLGGI